MNETWRTSTYSGQNCQCVETRRTGRAVQVRDTKDRKRGTLTIGADAWKAFIRL